MPARGNILSFPPADLTARSTPDIPAAEEAAAACAAETLAALVQLIRDSGMDPVPQLAGYLTTEDPTYLPECGRARALARHIGRDKLMERLIEEYMDHHPTDAPSPSL